MCILYDPTISFYEKSALSNIGGNYGGFPSRDPPSFSDLPCGPPSHDRLDMYEEDCVVVTNSDKRWRHGCGGVYQLIIAEYVCRKLINEN